MNLRSIAKFLGELFGFKPNNMTKNEKYCRKFVVERSKRLIFVYILLCDKVQLSKVKLENKSVFNKAKCYLAKKNTQNVTFILIFSSYRLRGSAKSLRKQCNCAAKRVYRAITLAFLSKQFVCRKP